jgi:hypothetical protein
MVGIQVFKKVFDGQSLAALTRIGLSRFSEVNAPLKCISRIGTDGVVIGNRLP